MCFDAQEPDNDEFLDDYGNNCYGDANIRQWLNSNSAPGNWYKPSHKKDAPPCTDKTTANPYVDFAGFLAEFKEAEQSAILETLVKSMNTGGKEPSFFFDKIFLLSSTEIGLEHRGEGTILPLFKDKKNLKCLPTEDAVKNSDTQWPGILDPDEPWYYWLRTPCASYSCYVRDVNTSGTLHHGSAYSGHRGLRPACNLSSGLLISEPDQNGVVSIMFDEKECENKGFKWESLELKDGRTLFDDYFIAALQGASTIAASSAFVNNIEDIPNILDILVNFSYEAAALAMEKREEYFSGEKKHERS
jgi:hypothetical protein